MSGNSEIVPLKNFRRKSAPSASWLTEDYKNLANRSRDIIYHYDIPSGKFLFFNKKGLEIYGHGTKKSVLMKIHPEDREMVRRTSRESLKNGCIKGEAEYRVCLADGSIRWMHDKWTVMRDTDGDPLAMEGIIRDNTANRLIQEELHKNKERYQMLVDTMNDGLVVQNEFGLLTYVNDEFCKMLKYDKAAFPGKSIRAFFDKTDKNAIAEQLKSDNTRANRFEVTCSRKDGERLHLLVSPKAIFDPDGSFRGSFAVITDITDLKKTEKKLKNREIELESKAATLQDLNAALKVLLKRREEDKAEIEQNVLKNFKELVAPYFHQLKDDNSSEKKKTTLEILESNLEEIISPFLNRIAMPHFNLTPTETQVANFVKQGRTSKEIAKLMGSAIRTVENHRNHIRKKLKISNKKSNLRTVLLSIQRDPSNCDELFSLL
jgi:PAS domain S-box-containing protein